MTRESSLVPVKASRSSIIGVFRGANGDVDEAASQLLCFVGLRGVDIGEIGESVE